MTALCTGGGPSSAQPGVTQALTLGGGALSTLFDVTGNPWLAAFAALVGVVHLDTTILCATDPPTLPAFSLADVNALTSLNDVNATLAALSKVRDAVANLEWPLVCQCNSGAQPTPPTISAPVGIPTTTTIVGNSGSPGPCDHQGHGAIMMGTYGGAVCQSLVPYNLSCGELVGAAKQPLPVGATSVVITPLFQTAGSLHPGGAFAIDWFNASATLIHTDNFNYSIFVPTQTFSVPSGAISYIIHADSSGSAPNSDLWGALIDVYCGNAPGTLQSACCPADQFTTGMLIQILQMVTLLQRQSVPFGYLASTTHTALSGDAQFAVQGLIGLAIAITTLPSRAGVEAGDPNVLWDVGWINVGTADGWFSRNQIKHNPQIIFPDDMGAVTLVGYSIPADVAVTITELVREP